MANIEIPDTVHGRLMEAVHISGYSFERACSELEWLLDEDRWKTIGKGFSNINDFLATIDFSGFRLAIEQRKKLAKRLKDIEASGRATAKMLGVGETTIRRDGAPNGAQTQEKPNETGAEIEAIAPNGAPKSWFQNAELNPAQIAKKESEKAGKATARRDERIEKIEAISLGNIPLQTARKYPVIYADPPWRYENPPMGGGNRSIENHYPTMTLEEICQLPVAEIAADDCILYMWATAPKLIECMEVIKTWGFDYRTNMVWVKDKIGMGYHARSQHELLLIAKRGEMPPPAPGTQPSSVIFAPRTEHSAKPHEFYEIIENNYPGVGKIELFCRSNPRDGWAAWGNQTEIAA